MKIRYLAFAGLAASFAAGAADIQKCAGNDGRVTYQDSPCPRGSAIGSVPRDGTKPDPAALQQLARERARMERLADAQAAQAAQPQQPLIVPVPVPAQPNAVGVAGQPLYTSPAYTVDSTTGAVVAPGNNVAAGVTQPIVPTPQPITQPPVDVPSAGTPLNQFPAATAPGAARSPAVIQLPNGTQSPASVQAPPTTIGNGTTSVSPGSGTTSLPGSGSVSPATGGTTNTGSSMTVSPGTGATGAMGSGTGR
jgi:hypothetical protein